MRKLLAFALKLSCSYFGMIIVISTEPDSLGDLRVCLAAIRYCT